MLYTDSASNCVSSLPLPLHPSISTPSFAFSTLRGFFILGIYKPQATQRRNRTIMNELVIAIAMATVCELLVPGTEVSAEEKVDILLASVVVVVLMVCMCTCT